MKNNTLLRTNLLVGMIIMIGFTAVSFISYRSNFDIYAKDVEMVSTLSSEGLYNEISSIFSQPVSVSLTMANDSLLKNFLTDERQDLEDDFWQDRMREYLNTYREKYGYDSVFLVSAYSNNYYHFEGLDRVLTLGEPENDWYYSFMAGDDDYSLNVDNDEATDDSITVFVNCKIRGSDGSALGVVGVGMQVHSLQRLLDKYEQQYGVRVYMVDGSGIIELSSSVTGYEKTNLFDRVGYTEMRSAILENTSTQERFWYDSGAGDGYVVSRYEPNLKWHLIVEMDTSQASTQFSAQFVRNVLIIVFITLLVIFIITTVIRRYNVRISELTVSQELEYQRLLHEMTEGLYDEIYELDITHDCAGGTGTREYFESLGMSADTSYDEALRTIAGKQIKPEYVQGYLETFAPAPVLEAFKNGISNLSYDFMITDDGTNYHWIRIAARVFYWNSDQSVRMITYRKNIDAEKRRELLLLEGIQRDSMTGLYNKRVTEELIAQTLAAGGGENEARHALIILDIDNFKTVNDSMGHSFGDHVINEIAAAIKTQFREDDVVGRIGGDEFAVLMKHIDSPDTLTQKLARLCGRIGEKDFGVGVGEHCYITCSVGVALYPDHGSAYTGLYEKADQALYHAKSHGKSSYCIFGAYAEHADFHTGQRDIELLMNSAADGLAQYACTEPLTLLYFNQACAELFGIPPTVLSASDFDPMAHVHPDDLDRVRAALTESVKARKPFANQFRALHEDGHYLSIRLKGIFINGLYQNQYPVFYTLYYKQDGT